MTKTVFTFLTEASLNKNLQKFREETDPRGKDEVELDEDLGEYKSIDEEETEVIERKKPTRRVSKTLLSLLHKHDERLNCNSSDANCLLMYITNNVNKFDFGDDITKLKQWLTKLQQIIRHIHPSTSTQRNAFVQFTSIFKGYWIKKGEGVKTGRHVEPIRDILRAESGRVAQLIAEKEEKLRSKLADKYIVDYSKVESNTRRMYARGMDPGAKREDIIALMLAIQTSAGMRKTAVIDPNIIYKQYTQTHDGLFRLGSIDDDDASLDEVREGLYEEVIGYEYTIRQFGKLKDSEQGINKFLDPEDERMMGESVIVKPTIILTSKEVILGIRTFRKFFNITKRNFRGRVLEGNRIGTRDILPLVKLYYPKIYAKGQANQWGTGSHVMRKIYANASYEIMKHQVQKVTRRFFDRSVWISTVLGHGGSVNTSLSYSVVEVNFQVSNDIFKIPPEHQIRLLQGQLNHNKQKLEELLEMINTKSAVSIAEMDTDQVGLIDQDGEMHTFTRHVKRKWKSERDRDETVKRIFDKLREKGVSTTAKNLALMGIGRGTLTAYKKRTNDSDHDEDVAVPTPIVDRPLRDNPVSKAILPVGTSVIANPNLSASANTKKQQLKRDRATFGDENVIETPDDCLGEIKKKQKVKTDKGSTLVRDLCIDER